jgi:hypothetical protein
VTSYYACGPSSLAGTWMVWEVGKGLADGAPIDLIFSGPRATAEWVVEAKNRQARDQPEPTP